MQIGELTNIGRKNNTVFKGKMEEAKGRMEQADQAKAELTKANAELQSKLDTLQAERDGLAAKESTTAVVDTGAVTALTVQVNALLAEKAALEKSLSEAVASSALGAAQVEVHAEIVSPTSSLPFFISSMSGTTQGRSHAPDIRKGCSDCNPTSDWRRFDCVGCNHRRDRCA